LNPRPEVVQIKPLQAYPVESSRLRSVTGTGSSGQVGIISTLPSPTTWESHSPSWSRSLRLKGKALKERRLL